MDIIRAIGHLSILGGSFVVAGPSKSVSACRKASRNGSYGSGLHRPICLGQVLFRQEKASSSTGS